MEELSRLGPESENIFTYFTPKSPFLEANNS